MLNNGLYSLWLMPSPPIRDTLRATIQELARRLGTPEFEPHITLLGNINGAAASSSERLRSLAAALGSISVSITNLQTTDHFDRSVILLADGDQLHTANQLARAAVGVADADDYRPHLSLVYGSLSDDVRRFAATQAQGLLPLRFPCTELRLYRTMGPVDEWRMLERVELGDSS